MYLLIFNLLLGLFFLTRFILLITRRVNYQSSTTYWYSFCLAYTIFSFVKEGATLTSGLITAGIVLCIMIGIFLYSRLDGNVTYSIDNLNEDCIRSIEQIIIDFNANHSESGNPATFSNEKSRKSVSFKDIRRIERRKVLQEINQIIRDNGKVPRSIVFWMIGTLSIWVVWCVLV